MRRLSEYLLFAAAITSIVATSVGIVRIQREHLEFLRDEMTAVCWRNWYAHHPPDVSTEMRNWHGRTIPRSCEVPE